MSMGAGSLNILWDPFTLLLLPLIHTPLLSVYLSISDSLFIQPDDLASKRRVQMTEILLDIAFSQAFDTLITPPKQRDPCSFSPYVSFSPFIFLDLIRPCYLCNPEDY